MKSLRAQVISFLGLAMGFISLLWLTSSLIAPARTQDMPSVSPPSAEVPTPVESPARDTETPIGDMEATQAEDSDNELLQTSPNDLLDSGFIKFQNNETYSYDPTGLRDPFRPYGIPENIAIPVPGQGENQSVPMPTGPIEELQKYELTQLKIVGIIWDVRKPKAMVKDPIGRVHLVRKSSKIGTKNGFVAEIREGEIVVVEPAIVDGMATANAKIMLLVR